MKFDPFNLTDRVAMVTGGNGGIGLSIAKGLAASGASVAIASRNDEKTSSAVKLLRGFGAECIGIKMDVTSEQSVTDAVEKVNKTLGSMNILVNNAGINIRKSPQDYTVNEWDKVQNVNLRGAFLCSKHVYAHLVNHGGGKIINIGSMTSIFGSDWVAAYSASKGGIVQLTKSLAIAWAKDNIQVNSILPGWIHTDLTETIKSQYPERYAFIKSRIPTGRWGESDDIAGTAIFLASSASNYVTGTSIPVDGGYTSF